MVFCVVRCCHVVYVRQGASAARSGPSCVPHAIHVCSLADWRVAGLMLRLTLARVVVDRFEPGCGREVPVR